MSIHTIKIGSTLGIWMKSGDHDVRVSVGVYVVYDSQTTVSQLRVSAHIEGRVGMGSIKGLDRIQTVYWFNADQIDLALDTQKKIAHQLISLKPSVSVKERVATANGDPVSDSENWLAKQASKIF
jgi:hypothetical protein